MGPGSYVLVGREKVGVNVIVFVVRVIKSYCQ